MGHYYEDSAAGVDVTEPQPGVAPQLQTVRDDGHRLSVQAQLLRRERLQRAGAARGLQLALLKALHPQYR